jgi:uncharacterized membrane protein
VLGLTPYPCSNVLRWEGAKGANREDEILLSHLPALIVQSFVTKPDPSYKPIEFCVTVFCAGT